MATDIDIQLKVHVHVVWLCLYNVLNFDFFKFKEEDFQLRSSTAYKYHCSLLSGPTAKNDSVTYGINYPSPLNKIDHFHVVNSQLPQDVMHVLLEGVLPVETKLMLRNFMSQRFFTLDFLNNRCKHFTYGRAESRNRPPKDFNAIHFSDSSNKLPLSGIV